MINLIITALFAFLMLFPAASYAVTIEPHLQDSASEARAEHLFTQLKCPVCDGQALSDSDATLARQMRAEIRQMVARDMSNDAVLLYFTDRYGAAILLAPPLNRSTALLWITPIILLLIGSIITWQSMRKRHSV